MLDESLRIVYCNLLNLYIRILYMKNRSDMDYNPTSGVETSNKTCIEILYATLTNVGGHIYIYIQ